MAWLAGLFAGTIFAPDALASEREEFSGNTIENGTSVTLTRGVVAAGGNASSGGAFSINGTIGQADVDPLQPSTGGNFAITGGFWFTSAPQTDGLFDDGFESP